MLFIKTSALSLLVIGVCYAQEQILPNIELKVGTGQLDTSIRLLILLTVLSLAPSILIMTTSFVRIVIVLSLIRQALGVPTVPPNQVIVSLALFMTFFIMKPVFENINQNALQPLLRGEITDVVASILIAMGILLIPPQIISLPLKLMLFILANGWELVILSLVRSYQ